MDGRSRGVRKLCREVLQVEPDLARGGAARPEGPLDEPPAAIAVQEQDGRRPRAVAIHGDEPGRQGAFAFESDPRVRQGVVRSQKPTAPRGQWHPVDSFFRSLAEDQGERAVAIVLSGTGSNGSLGLRFVKAEGGIVLVQEPESARFDGMPRSAIATGIADLVLLPEEMPRALVDMLRHTYLRTPAKAKATSAQITTRSCTMGNTAWSAR